MSRAALGLGLGLLGGVPARAAGPEVWFAQQDARLAESADRDVAAAIAIYETLLAHLPAGDPFASELLLDLARARFDEGDLEGCRSALGLAVADPQTLARARSWRTQLDAWQQRVQRLPLSWQPGSGPAPLVLGWSASPDASLLLTDHALTWRTVVRESRDDYLILALGEGNEGPHTIGIRLEAEDMTAHLRLIAEDAAGRRWATPVIRVEPGLEAELLVSLSELLPTHPALPQELAPDQVKVLLLQDVTAFHSLGRGPNDLRILALDLR